MLRFPSSLRAMRRDTRGFTLTEILISVSLLALISVSITQAFLFLNKSSSRSRVASAAMVAAQQEIDSVMSVRPWTTVNNLPQMLRIQSEGGTLAAGESWANSSTVMRTVPLLVVAAKGTGIVNGVLTRKITKVNDTLRQIDVVVGYNFGRGTNASTYTYSNQTQFEADYKYQVRTSTFRSPDE